MSKDVAKLIRDLEHADLQGRAKAAEALARLGAEAQVAEVALVRAAADEETVREWAVAALEELGPPLASDMPALAALVSHASPDAGYWAATLLGRLGADATPAVPALAAALSGPCDMAVRERAAWALGQIGRPSESATVALEKAAGSGEARLADLARKALARIKG